jgi:hypothetical protein
LFRPIRHDRDIPGAHGVYTAGCTPLLTACPS